MSNDAFSAMSMLDLFRAEADSQSRVLTSGLLVLERTPEDAAQLEACMRAAHSLKGAARIVERAAAVAVAHAMEDCIVAAQEGRIQLRRAHIDQLLRGVDLLLRIARGSEANAAMLSGAPDRAVERFIADLAAVSAGGPAAASAAADAPASGVGMSAAGPDAVPATPEAPASRDGTSATTPADDRVLRVSVGNFDRLLGLAGESLVETRRLRPFSQSLLRLRRLQHELGRDLDRVRDALGAGRDSEETRIAQAEARRRLQACTAELAQHLSDLDAYERRWASLSQRLYDEAIAVRMRPFADAGHGLPRMVRDLAQTLGRQARLEIRGNDTEVDRDILERLEAPLGHLLRNAVDHGIESPAERVAAGKQPEGRIELEARHCAGRLQVTVADDGRGIDLGRLRTVIVARKLTNAETAATLSDSELLEFLFLPGMSLRATVTDVSGRGVGLDVVQTVVKQLRGTTRVSVRPEGGMLFQLTLPLTLSVMRALLVDIAGEPYAFPLGQVARAVKVPLAEIGRLEGRQHFSFGGRRIPLVAAHQVLELGGGPAANAEVAVVIIGSGVHACGLAVDRLLGERELVVQPLDPRFGKLRDIAAAALMEDGSPVLILDLEDVLRSVEKLVTAGPTPPVQSAAGPSAVRQKRVLIVDDSLTVRELERKLLESRGYAVEVAVDGMDGWNAVRGRAFDLVVTDIDMPRMDGFELVTLIRRDPKLKSLPVMIVSYKDREADRQRGLDAGADYYLAKGSFHDETLHQAVFDLIGEARG